MHSSSIEKARRVAGTKRHAALATALALFTICLFFSRDLHAGADPHLAYETIKTKHFSVTYESQSREVGQHVADIAESIFDELSRDVGWIPAGRTEILLTDPTDAANGSATALPYNAVRLLITAPDDLSPLGDVDDWYIELVTHEYTHILHTDHIRGIPALANAIVGKTFAPNQVQPRWLLEGLAVYEESERTSGGRLRSSEWNMWMRADVLENNVATLDQFSNSVRRFPQGNIWYLYGSFFLGWIADTYGEEALRQMAHDYGANPIPYGFNRSIRRATGRTFEELYPAWVDTMKREYGAQADRARARGIREGTQVTHQGETALYPRWIPDNAFPHTGPTLAYYGDDGHTRTGIYSLPLTLGADGSVKSNEHPHDLLLRSTGTSMVSWDASGNSFYNSLDIFQNLYTFGDLFTVPAKKKSDDGREPYRKRLTEGYRAYEPDVSHDGRHIVFTTNHRGTRYLQIAELEGEPPTLQNLHTLVPSQRWEQAFTPRFSPDGRYVAYSVWTYGGYRDIRVVDTKDGTYVEIAHDRAVDGGPSFSPDGRTVYFHSDRTGIMNVYAWDRETHVISQVTNVINGAYEPEVSPDGKWLAYTGFTHLGFDIFVMPLDKDKFLPAEPYADNRPSPPPIRKRVSSYTQPYNPLTTLYPRAYSASLAPGAFGNQAATVSVVGSDVAGIHSIAATMVVEMEKPELQGSLSYSYARLPFDVSMGVSRDIGPRPGVTFGGQEPPTVVTETVAATTAVSYLIPASFDGQSFTASYTFARVGADFAYPIAQLNPYDTPSFPPTGRIGSLHLAYGYSDVEQFLWSVGREKGMSFGVSFDWADPILGGDFAGYTVGFDLTRYFLMPWLSHNSLALHLGTSTSGGDFPGRGTFYLGGFVDTPDLVNTLRNQLIQGGFVLRGYPVDSVYGSSYILTNTEYRFPIHNFDRGLSTLPAFLNRLTGDVFADYGSAFNSLDTIKFKLGTGAELQIETTLAYATTFIFRVGYAHGWQSLGVDKTYFVAAVPY